MHRSNIEPRRSWASHQCARQATRFDDLVDDAYLCLSCGSFSGTEAFCERCRDRSRQTLLSPEWDDLGVGD